MNKYLRWTLLKWIRIEQRLNNRKKRKAGKDPKLWSKGYRLSRLENEIEFINKPSYGLFERMIGPKQPKHIEHYVPIDWAKRREEFLDPAGIPEESRAWAEMDRETFLTTADPLIGGSEKWFAMNWLEFYEALELDGFQHPEVYE